MRSGKSKFNENGNVKTECVNKCKKNVVDEIKVDCGKLKRSRNLIKSCKGKRNVTKHEKEITDKGKVFEKSHLKLKENACDSEEHRKAEALKESLVESRAINS